MELRRPQNENPRFRENDLLEKGVVMIEVRSLKQSGAVEPSLLCFGEKIKLREKKVVLDLAGTQADRLPGPIILLTFAFFGQKVDYKKMG